LKVEATFEDELVSDRDPAGSDQGDRRLHPPGGGDAVVDGGRQVQTQRR